MVNAAVEDAFVPAVMLIPPAPEAVILLFKTTPPPPLILTVNPPTASLITPESLMIPLDLILAIEFVPDSLSESELINLTPGLALKLISEGATFP